MGIEPSSVLQSQSDSKLSSIFRDALAQPSYIAVKRIKIAFAFERVSADAGSILQRAFMGSGHTPLGVNLVGRFVAGKVGFGSEESYWRYNVLEDYIDGHAAVKNQRDDLLALLRANYDADPHSYRGKDAEKIIAYFQDYSNS